MAIKTEDDKYIYGSMDRWLAGLRKDLEENVILKKDGPPADEVYEVVRDFLSGAWDLLPEHREFMKHYTR